MNNKILIAVIIVLVIIGGFFLFNKEDEEPIVTEEIDLSGVVTHEVILTADGYIPEDITIKKGEAVIFRTTEGNLFWPASNIHPSHTIYPEFDPKIPVSPDETWAFVFDELGAWKYHDHLNPIYRGVINVVE